jgi:hypothetical protein
LKSDVMKGVDEVMLLTVVHESNKQKLRYELAATQDGQAIRAINKRRIGGEIGPCTERGTSSQILPSPSIMMLVSGLNGIICEVPIPQNSTIMDARKAIFAASGIPIQNQHLLLGCTKLDDPSAMLIVDPVDEQIHLTCVHSALDSADVCKWCCKVLGVPVEVKCRCKSLYCVTCIRDMVGMTGQPPKCQTCPTCSTQFRFGSKSAASVYTKRLDLVAHLDDKYGKVECPRGCGQSYHRSNAPNHMAACTSTVKVCRSCKQSYTGQLATHQVQCPSSNFEGYYGNLF